MAQTSNNTDVFAQTVAGGGSSSTVFDGFFGDGSDGDVVITTTVTLTVDRYYNNLTIDTGGTLKPRGQHVFVKNVLTINPRHVDQRRRRGGRHGGQRRHGPVQHQQRLRCRLRRGWCRTDNDGSR